MLGAIIGDIIGSRFEWHNVKHKEFDLFTDACTPTDDSYMTMAVAQAILDSNGEEAVLPQNTVKRMQEFGHKYPDGGYGGHFAVWLQMQDTKPYNSYGNGAAMRVSACAYAADNALDVRRLARLVTATTHNHPEGIRGAEAVVTAILTARKGGSKEDIRNVINEGYYPMNFTLDEIREDYEFNETCQETVPQAIMAFLESESFEDAIRNAISIGGDSDTLAAITGSIAEAFYGIPEEIQEQALYYLDDFQEDVLTDFYTTYGDAFPYRNILIK